MRTDYLILSTLQKRKCTDYFHSLTISEIIDLNRNESGKHCLGVRQTVYRKLQRLLDMKYIAKGVKDNHADSYYLDQRGIRLMNSLAKEQ